MIPPLRNVSSTRQGRPGASQCRSAGAIRRTGWTLALVAGALCSGCQPDPVPGPPNLVIICIDTLRADRMSMLGADRPTTPFLEELAGDGTLFSSGQSTSNWTVPAVGSLFTGVLPSRHGALIPDPIKHLGVAPEFPNELSEELPTLAERLGAAGYRSALVSGNPYLSGRFEAGFDLTRVRRELARDQLPPIQSWIGQDDGRPFFLYWQIMDLHQPLEPSDSDARRFLENAPDGYPEKSVRNWAFGAVREPSPAFEEYRRLKLALYDGALVGVDALLRTFVRDLNEIPDSRETIVLVTSDHGEEFWDHAAPGSRHEDDPRGIWGIGHGHTMYQELLRVPILVVGPGIVPGRRDECPVSLADVFPTVLEFARLEPPPGLDGQSLRARLRASRPACRDRSLFSESPAYGPDSVAIRRGAWKLVSRDGHPPRLYDLSTDPGERRDLSGDRRRELRALLAEIGSRPPSAEHPGSPSGRAVDEEQRKQLRALGYLP